MTVNALKGLGLAAGAVLAGGVLAACGDQRPEPETDPNFQPIANDEKALLSRLRGADYGNGARSNVLQEVRAHRDWNKQEAGDFLVGVRHALGKSQAVDAWRLTKLNGRDTGEIAGMVQALDSQTTLSQHQIYRVTLDVLQTGFDARETVRFFGDAARNRWTSNEDDIRIFEQFLGLRYPGWEYSDRVVFEPFYYPDYYYDPAPGYDDWSGYLPAGPGDEYGPGGVHIPLDDDWDSGNDYDRPTGDGDEYDNGQWNDDGTADGDEYDFGGGSDHDFSYEDPPDTGGGFWDDSSNFDDSGLDDSWNDSSNYTDSGFDDSSHFNDSSSFSDSGFDSYDSYSSGFEDSGFE